MSPKYPNPASSGAAKSSQLSGSERVSSNEMATLALQPDAVAVRERNTEILVPVGSYTELTDADVMLRVKAGDDAAFDYLVDKFRRPIVSFMYRMAHNQAVAEELAQEVFLRVYRSRHTYAAEAKFTTWLYRIATNLGVNHARDSKADRVDQTVSIDEHDEETGLAIDVADPHITAEQAILRRERLAAIRRHVENLPERQRMAVLMHKYQNMDYRQIADVLKLSESATKSLLFRAYETLRERLKEFI
jgi:RNA polymerase sigma-70 factor (ECF subfamily)